MPKRNLWYVADMDEGILIERQTRKECVQWAMDESLTHRVLERSPYGPADYSYTLAGGDREDCSFYHVLRGDRLEHHGYPVDQEPLYNDPEHPFQRTRKGRDED